MVFNGSRLAFHGSRWVFVVFHGSRLVLHGAMSVFMVFYGSRLVLRPDDLVWALPSYIEIIRLWYNGSSVDLNKNEYSFNLEVVMSSHTERFLTVYTHFQCQNKKQACPANKELIKSENFLNK